jgi:hypothetical protein
VYEIALQGKTRPDTAMSLTGEQRRALVLLARNTHGATEALMLAHGFRREMLAGLVLAGSRRS